MSEKNDLKLRGAGGYPTTQNFISTDARGDRGGDVARKARDPAPLLVEHHRFLPAAAWLEARNLDRPVTERLLYGVLLLKAVALGLREVPELNGFWIGGRAAQSEAIHLGVAVSLRGGGLVAPALRDADRQPLDELMRNFQDLVTRARAGIAPQLGDDRPDDHDHQPRRARRRGGLRHHHPPQLALVGFGTMVERPWVVDGRVVPRRVITATLSGDHRATDGHRGVVFSPPSGRLLQEPEKL